MFSVDDSPGPGPDPEGTVPTHGEALLVRLQEVASEVSGLLSRVVSAHRAPVTSQDRRRIVHDAERASVNLAGVSDDLGVWISRQGAPDGQGVHPAPPSEQDGAVPDGQRVRQVENLTAGAGTEAGADAGTDVSAEVRALSGVSRAQEAVDGARHELHRTVEAARASGASWRQIGSALGIAAQTAHKRFDPKARQRHADYMRERYQRLRKD